MHALEQTCPSHGGCLQGARLFQEMPPAELKHNCQYKQPAVFLVKVFRVEEEEAPASSGRRGWGSRGSKHPCHLPSFFIQLAA